MLHILRRELYTIFTDKGVLIVFFVACLVYPMVCGYIYNHEVMTDMPVAVVDKSNTALSREYIRRVDATPEVRIARSCESLQEAQNLQRHSQVHGIIYIPEDFSTSINTKRQTTVSIYADVTSFFWYRNLALASSSVSLTMGGKTALPQAKCMTKPSVRFSHSSQRNTFCTIREAILPLFCRLSSFWFFNKPFS